MSCGPHADIRQGDVLARLGEMRDGSVHCVVTSPPYWGLRDYDTPGQLGLEPTPDAYVAKMIEVFREIRRVLRDDGTCWLNIGDSYAGGLKPKDLVGIPWRLAFALQADGWYLRADVIWAKGLSFCDSYSGSVMPDAATDRPTRSHEYLFLLTKSARYYYDAEAVREQGTYPAGRELRGSGTREGNRIGTTPVVYSGTRNLRSVWAINSEPFSEAHFATFPQALVEPCIKAGTKADDIVLDPFCGSGTAGIVALRLGRKFIGIDLSSGYCRMARERILGPLFAGAVDDAD